MFGYRFLLVAWAYIEELREQYGFVGKTTAFMLALLVSLLFAQLATLADLHMIIGGFIAGMFLRQSDVEPSLHEHMHTVIYDLAMGFFAPVFFVTVGFDITFEVFFESFEILVTLVAVAFLGKIIGSWLFALPTSLTSREGLVIGFGMNGRGTVEIIIASVALSAGVIDTQLFSILVFIAIFTTALVPATVTWGYVSSSARTNSSTSTDIRLKITNLLNNSSYHSICLLQPHSLSVKFTLRRMTDCAGDGLSSIEAGGRSTERYFRIGGADKPTSGFASYRKAWR